MDLFTINISSVCWDSVCRTDNVNDMFLKFKQTFMKEFNKAFPLKTIKLQDKHKKNKNNEWYTEEIRLLADNIIN